jgi:hypothetical protein
MCSWFKPSIIYNKNAKPLLRSDESDLILGVAILTQAAKHPQDVSCLLESERCPQDLTAVESRRMDEGRIV